jgi:hypothetical protein
MAPNLLLEPALEELFVVLEISMSASSPECA